jgi:hypothetical protein
MAEIELPHFRRAFADVPEDVDPDDLPHFNDPNFDMRSIYSTSTDNSLELEDKKKAYSVDDHKFSSAGSDFDTESALGTTTRGGSSRAELREDHDEYVRLAFEMSPTLIRHAASLRTLRSARLSRASTTR